MVDENASKTQVQFLKYLVWVLLTFLTVSGSWTMLEMYRLKSDLPEKYVRLERYQCDQKALQGSVNKLIDKVDETNRYLRDNQ